jgi:hypothetical protein
MTEDYGYPNGIDYWQSGSCGYPVNGSISSVSSGGPPVTVTTTAAHNLSDGHIVTISGVTGAGATINATHTIDVTGTTTFTVPVSTTGAGSGGTWSFDQRDAVLRAVLRDLKIAGYAETVGVAPWNSPATDAYTGKGIVDSEPGRYNKKSSPITTASGGVSTAVDGPSYLTINTTAPHGLITGWTVEIADVMNNSDANGTFVVTVADADTFTIPIQGETETGTGGGWRLIGATNTIPIYITSYEHSLPDGASITINDVVGNSAANGSFTITRVDDHRFTLNSTTGTGNGIGGSWTSNHWADREHGALVRSSGVHVENAEFFYIPGTCLVVAAGSGDRNSQFLPFDSEKARGAKKVSGTNGT